MAIFDQQRSSGIWVKLLFEMWSVGNVWLFHITSSRKILDWAKLSGSRSQYLTATLQEHNLPQFHMAPSKLSPTVHIFTNELSMKKRFKFVAIHLRLSVVNSVFFQTLEFWCDCWILLTSDCLSNSVWERQLLESGHFLNSNLFGLESSEILR